MSDNTRHPLDIDLLDYVEGKLDEPRSASLAAHLWVCGLCSLKRERLARWEYEREPYEMGGEFLT